MRKPRPVEFMVRGYTLADALAILERWESLSASEIEALDFTASQLGEETYAISASSPGRRSRH